jgi:hypothetical protein
MAKFSKDWNSSPQTQPCRFLQTKRNPMISLSEEPQFSAEDIYEIPTGVGRTDFEFDMSLIGMCHPLFQGFYDSHELLANELVHAGVIRDWDMNLSTKSTLIVRFKSQRASQTFIKRLNTYLHKCWIKRRPTCNRGKVATVAVEGALPQEQVKANL